MQQNFLKPFVPQLFSQSPPQSSPPHTLLPKAQPHFPSSGLPACFPLLFRSASAPSSFSVPFHPKSKAGKEPR